MPAAKRTRALGLLASLVVAGCRSVEPTVAPLPTTAPQATVAAADTPLPPTGLPALPTVPSAATAAEPGATTKIPPVPPASPTPRPGYFSRDRLIEDARQLAQTVESAHPDPYVNGGGKIAFHRRLHSPSTVSR